MASFSNVAFSTSAFADTAWDFGTPAATSTKTGTGGIDGGKFIVKPSGLDYRPRKKLPAVIEERVEEAHQAHTEARAKVEQAFDAEKYLPQMMTAEQRDGEIARLLHLRIRTEGDEILLLLLMAAAV